MRSKGMVALRNAGRQEDIARKLGVSQGTVSKWGSGTKPLYENRILMRDRLKIPVQAWDEPVETSPQAAA
ncbi:hypothetical protein WMF20_35455 [Sorangium sp. So ce834]|uniref:hypothetical protein n=1 Tax=Sorangium sp. So ce834 TaxID=3133321 RepID=UPI003F624AB7